MLNTREAYYFTLQAVLCCFTITALLHVGVPPASLTVNPGCHSNPLSGFVVNQVPEPQRGSPYGDGEAEKLAGFPPRTLGSFPAFYSMFVLVSFRITSWAPPSIMLVEDTIVILAFCLSSGKVRAPQLHMVALILPRVTVRLSFSLPA